MAESCPCDDSPSPGYCKHSLYWTLAGLLSWQLGTKQLCVTWEAWLESQWPGILFLAAGMYTVASWRAPQCLTGEPRRFCVSCSFFLSLTTLPSFSLENVLVLFSLEVIFVSEQIDQIFWILLIFWGQEVRFHSVTDVVDELATGSSVRHFSQTHQFNTHWMNNNASVLLLLLSNSNIVQFSQQRPASISSSN